MRWLALLVVIFVVLVMGATSNSLEKGSSQSLESDLSAEAAASENLIVTSRESTESQVPHKRSKRTIGHIFDMFRKMMDGLFGGKKGGGNGGGGGYGAPGKGKGKGRGRPRRPQRPGQPPSGGYGAPRPQNNNLSGGYAGGQRPRVPPRQRPPSNNYGGPPPQSAPNGYGGPPPQSAPNNYGGPNLTPQSAPNNYGGPPQSAPNNYGGPPQSASNNYGGPPPQQNNPDSYGAPQADPVGPNQDSYGAPQADPVGPNQDSYGAPQADPVGPAQDSYGSPQAAPVGPSNPISNYGRGQSSAPRRPTNSGSFGPGSAIKILPAPNLATEAPQGDFQRGQQSGGGAPDSYGSPLANTISGNSAAQDSYGSPQGGVISAASPNSAPDSYGSPQGGVISAASPQSGRAPDSYGSPQGGVISDQQSGGASNSYGAPQNNNFGAPQPQTNTNSFGQAQVTSQYQVSDPGPQVSQNPFLINNSQQPTYNAAPLPVTNNSPFNTAPRNIQNSAGQSQSTYGNSQNSYSSPVTDIDIPGGSNPIIIEGRNPAPQTQDVYGSPVAPVGTSAPVPEEVISAERQQTSFDTYGSNNLDNDAESLADPNSLSTPEGELASIQEEGEGETSPLFDDLRNVAFTSADTATEALEPLEVDLSDGVVDLTNGLDTYGNNEVDLTSNVDTYDSTVGPSTTVPEYEDDIGYEYEYIGDEDVPPEFPDELAGAGPSTPPAEVDFNNLADAQETYGDAQETYGNSIQDDTYEYNGEYDSEYYYEYEDDQAANAGTTEAAPGEVGVEEGGNFISVPLMIEEVPADTAPVILAGTAKDTTPAASYGGQQATYAGRAGRNSSPSKRRAPTAFQTFIQETELPQAKRQADWSQRIETRRRNRVWRQFNLD